MRLWVPWLNSENTDHTSRKTTLAVIQFATFLLVIKQGKKRSLFIHSKCHVNYSNGKVTGFRKTASQDHPYGIYTALIQLWLLANYPVVLISFFWGITYSRNRFNTYFKCHRVSVDQIQFIGEFSRNLHRWTFTT